MSAGFVAVIFLLLTIFPVRLYNNFTSDGETVVVTGYVNTLRYRNDKLQIYLKKVIFSDDHSSKLQLNNNVYGFETDSFGAVAYVPMDIEAPRIGERIQLRGTLRNMTRATNPGQFDMAAYYRIRGYDFSLTSCAILKRSKSYNVVLHYVYTLRRFLEKCLMDGLGDTDGGILCAMLLGDKDYMNQDLSDLFSRAGIAHLMVVSGTHIGIIGVFFFELLSRLTKSMKLSSGISAAFVIFYGLLTGMGSSTFRAVIMYFLCVTARMLGRAYDILTALCFSAVISLIFNPLQIYDSGFLLSYSAVLSIALVNPVVDRLMGRFMKKIKIPKPPGLSVSLSITIFSLPLTLWLFSQITVYSIFLNLILIPLSGVLIGSGIIFLFLCFPVTFLILPQRVCLMICHAIVLIYRELCKLSVALPGSVIITGKPSLWSVVLYYLVLMLVLMLAYKEKDHVLDAHLTRAAAAFFVLVLLLMFVRIHDFELTMLDVGQGLCVVARDKDKCILFDGGSSDVSEVSKYRIIPALKSMGISKVDIIFVSHTDSDHINGITGWLSDFDNYGIKIKAIAMSHNSSNSNAGREIISLAKNKKIKTYAIGAGDEIRLGAMEMECVFPDKKEEGDTNELSLCLKLKHDNFCSLLCGDVEGIGEEKLIEAIRNSKKEKAGDVINLFQVAHHGSAGTNSAELLDVIKPQLSLISAGHKNSYGHPHKETLERLNECGSKYMVTIESGAISVKQKNNRLFIDSFLKVEEKDEY